MPMTIETILQAGFEPALGVILAGRPFANDRLNEAIRLRRVHIAPTAPEIELDGVRYPIQESVIPIVWSDGDVEQNHRENDKIRLVKSLIVNAVSSMDDVFLRLIGDHRAAVLRTYKYSLGPTIYDGEFLTTKLYRLYADFGA